MQIRIISEKKVKPLQLGFPDTNPTFFDICFPVEQELHLPHGRDILRIFMHQKVHESMWRHCHLSVQQELGGALMGYYGVDKGQRFVLITDVLHQPPEYYASPTLLRFTNQFYDDLNVHIDQVQKKHPNLLRLGMYHTHPGYGVFLSNTDVDTFKGIFKDEFQIAVVVDPLKDEEGVFFWHEKDISPPAPFKTYQTQNPQFQLHHSTTYNPLLAQYNAHLQLAPSQHIQPKIEYPSELPTNNLSEKKEVYLPTQQKKSSIGKREKITITTTPKVTVHNQKKESMQVMPLEYIPRMCPLYNMKYKNYQIRLYRYFKPLKTAVQLNEYPYYIFVHLDLRAKLEQHLQKQSDLTALLVGRFHFDKLKNLYFIDVFDALISTTTEDLYPPNKIAQLYVSQNAKNKIMTIGWIHISQDFSVPTFPFF